MSKYVPTQQVALDVSSKGQQCELREALTSPNIRPGDHAGRKTTAPGYFNMTNSLKKFASMSRSNNTLVFTDEQEGTHSRLASRPTSPGGFVASDSLASSPAPSRSGQFDRRPNSPDGDKSVDSGLYSNSLFGSSMASQSLAIESYIASLDKKESWQQMTFEPSTFDYFEEQAKLPNTNSNDNLLVIKYRNKTCWDAASIDPKVVMLKFKLAQDIIYRDTILFRASFLVKKLDTKYWKYSVARIHATEKSETINSAELVAKRNSMLEVTKELSICIAHFRSISISIIDSVKSLRSIYKRIVTSKDTISIFWKQQNFLIAMMEGLSFINEFQTMRLWLGFQLTPLVIAPSPNNHTPKQKHKEFSNKLYQSWLASHDEHMRHIRPKPKAVDKSTTGVRKSSTFQALSVKELKKLAAKKVVQNEVSKIVDSALYKVLHGSDDDIVNRGQEEEKGDGDENQEQSAVLAEEWVQLREYCKLSWGFNKETGVYEQSVESAPDFWSNLDHNPLIVQAALGFEEVFPSVYVVPAMTGELRKQCKRYERLMIDELEMEQEILEWKRNMLELKSTLQSTLPAEALAQVLQNEEEKKDQHAAENDRLRLRQQRKTELLTGISVENLTGFLKEYGSMHHSSRVLQAVDTHRQTQFRKWDLSRLQQQNEAAAPDTVFFTAVQCQQQSHVISDEREAAASLVDYTNMTNIELNATLGVSDRQYPIVKEIPRFRIESSKLRTRIEAKIEESRRIVEWDLNTGMPLIREDKKGRREPSRLDAAWLMHKVVDMQRVIRGFNGRRRFLKFYQAARLLRGVVGVQSRIRGFIGRISAKRRRRQYNIESYLLRKRALKEHLASLVITHFIVELVNADRFKRGDPLLKVSLDNKGRSIVKHGAANNRRGKNGTGTGAIPGLGRRKAVSGGQASPSNSSLNFNIITTTTASSGVFQGQLATDDELQSRSNSPAIGGSRGRLQNHNAQDAIGVAPDEQQQQQQQDETASTVSDESSFTKNLNKQNDKHMQDELVLQSNNAAKAREMEMQVAKELIARLNEGKMCHDTVRNSRLIPKKTIKCGTNSVAIPCFSTKNYAFIRNPDVEEPSSFIGNTLEVFQERIPVGAAVVVGPTTKKKTIKNSSPSAGWAGDSAQVEEARGNDTVGVHGLEDDKNNQNLDYAGMDFTATGKTASSTYSALSTPFPDLNTTTFSNEAAASATWRGEFEGGRMPLELDPIQSCSGSVVGKNGNNGSISTSTINNQVKKKPSTLFPSQSMSVLQQQKMAKTQQEVNAQMYKRDVESQKLIANALAGSLRQSLSVPLLPFSPLSSGVCGGGNNNGNDIGSTKSPLPSPQSNPATTFIGTDAEREQRHAKELLSVVDVKPITPSQSSSHLNDSSSSPSSRQQQQQEQPQQRTALMLSPLQIDTGDRQRQQQQLMSATAGPVPGIIDLLASGKLKQPPKVILPKQLLKSLNSACSSTAADGGGWGGGSPAGGAFGFGGSGPASMANNHNNSNSKFAESFPYGNSLLSTTGEDSLAYSTTGTDVYYGHNNNNNTNTNFSPFPRNDSANAVSADNNTTGIIADGGEQQETLDERSSRNLAAENSKKGSSRSLLSGHKKRPKDIKSVLKTYM